MQSLRAPRVSPMGTTLTAVAILSACSAGPSTRPEVVDATSRPTATAPAVTPEPTPTASPSPTFQAVPAPAELVLAITYDYYGGIWTTTSLVADGRLTSPGRGGYQVQVLSTSGVERIRAEALATGVFAQSAQLPLVLAQNAALECLDEGLGNWSYVTIDLATDTGLVTVTWQRAHLPAECYEPSPARDRLEALLERLENQQGWLPTEAWVDPITHPHEPEAFRLFTISQPSEDRFGRPPDVTAVAWPLAGTLTTYGSAHAASGAESFAVRCGVVSTDEATAVVDALADAGASMDNDQAPGYASGTIVGDAANDVTVAVVLEAMRPDEAGCEGADAHFINCWNLGGVELFYCATP